MWGVSPRQSIETPRPRADGPVRESLMISTYRSLGYGRHARRWGFVGAALWGFIPAVMLIALILARNAVGLLIVAGLAALWMWPVYTDLFRRTHEIRILETGGLEFE